LLWRSRFHSIPNLRLTITLTLKSLFKVDLNRMKVKMRTSIYSMVVDTVNLSNVIQAMEAAVVAGETPMVAGETLMVAGEIVMVETIGVMAQEAVDGETVTMVIGETIMVTG
jgi:hypothetical protein